MLVVKKCCLRGKKMKGEGTLSLIAGFIADDDTMLADVDTKLMVIQS